MTNAGLSDIIILVTIANKPITTILIANKIQRDLIKSIKHNTKFGEKILLENSHRKRMIEKHFKNLSFGVGWTHVFESRCGRKNG